MRARTSHSSRGHADFPWGFRGRVVPVSLLDGNAMEYSEVGDPIIPLSGFTTLEVRSSQSVSH